jgi:uncharacterized membrane protein (UPF0136 family)
MSAAVCTYVVALLVGVGGAIGFVKAGSVMSLLSGGVFSILLAYAASQIPSRSGYQLSIGEDDHNCIDRKPIILPGINTISFL